MPDNLAVAWLNVHTAQFKPLPQFGGTEAVLYRSPDGTRIAGTFRESGAHTLTMEYDEFIYVVSGGVTVTVSGGEPQGMNAGDAFHLPKGMTVDLEMSDDFQDFSVLVSDKSIAY